MSTEASEFDAAKSIVQTLKGMDKGKQERVLRWVAETLGVTTTTMPASGPTTAFPSPPHGSPHPPSEQALGKQDIKSFVASKKPKSDVQFAAVAAYFYRFEAPPAHRKDKINSVELQEATRLAGWRRFKTPSVPLDNGVKQGYLDRVGGGYYAVNSVGENLVAMTLPGEVRENGKGARRRTNRGTGDTKRRSK
jgi:hypothetical protein